MNQRRYEKLIVYKAALDSEWKRRNMERELLRVMRQVMKENA